MQNISKRIYSKPFTVLKHIFILFITFCETLEVFCHRKKYITSLVAVEISSFFIYV